jgi:hypothetical protein
MIAQDAQGFGRIFGFQSVGQIEDFFETCFLDRFPDCLFSSFIE